MVKMITENDLNVIEEIAKKYGLSVNEFGKIVVSQTKKKTVKQIRFTEDEYKKIEKDVRENGGTFASFCEQACQEFIGTNKHSNKFMELRGYGQKRDKRVNVYFKDRNLEKKVEDVALGYGVEIGLLIRYCVLEKIKTLDV